MIWLLLMLVGPLVVAAATARTKAWWVGGISLFAIAVFWFTQIEEQEHSGSPVDAIGALGNAIAMIAGIGFSIYGLIVLLVTYAAYQRAQRARAERVPQLPVAIVRD